MYHFFFFTRLYKQMNMRGNGSISVAVFFFTLQLGSMLVYATPATKLITISIINESASYFP